MKFKIVRQFLPQKENTSSKKFGHQYKGRPGIKQKALVLDDVIAAPAAG